MERDLLHLLFVRYGFFPDVGLAQYKTTEGTAEKIIQLDEWLTDDAINGK